MLEEAALYLMCALIYALHPASKVNLINCCKGKAGAYMSPKLQERSISRYLCPVSQLQQS